MRALLLSIATASVAATLPLLTLLPPPLLLVPTAAGAPGPGLLLLLLLLMLLPLPRQVVLPLFRHRLPLPPWRRHNHPGVCKTLRPVRVGQGFGGRYSHAR